MEVEVWSLTQLYDYFGGFLPKGSSREGWPRGAWPLQFWEQRNEVRSQKSHSQGLCQLFLTASWYHCAAPSAAHPTPSLFLCISRCKAQGESAALEG